ncbi:MAG: molybdopterin cofactor-binding domain-containing protein [Pseudomonadota bacterium]
MLDKFDAHYLNPSRRAVDRRQFLKAVSLGAAGFAVGCGRGEPADPAHGTAANAGVAADEPVFSDLNAFVRVGSDDTVTVIVKHLDKGQGVTTGLPAIVAEELGARWDQMRAEFAPADASRYNNLMFGPAQGTGGSTSVANSWEQLRTAAAGARDMLKAAAAAEWNVEAAEITLGEGRLSHEGLGREAGFGELAAAAAAMPVPEAPALKPVDEFTLIGTRLPRLDSPAKTDGSAVFTLDVTRPGMLIAVVARPPRFGGRVGRLDATAARAVDGVRDVVEIDRGVAVLADSYPAALAGRAALDIDWNDDNAETRGSAELFDAFKALLQNSGASARDDGDVEAALGGASRRVDAEFAFPYLAHAAMEPLDCVVELGDGRCEIWTGSQLPTIDQTVAANVAGLTPADVVIHTQFAGGSFGRRAVADSDFVAEAVMIAKAIDGRAPVKLQWSREDDMRGGRYRPMSVHRMSAGIDDDGNVVGWDHSIVAQSVMRGTPFEGAIQNDVDPSTVEGARGLPYAIPNIRVESHLADAGVPVLWWRSVGHTHNGYVTEVFLDAIAEAAGRDPVAMRQALLQDKPRHLAVLNLAVEKAGWGSSLPAGHGRGVAVHESFGSFVAQVAEVTLADDGALSVDRVVCAVDCGIAITPDVIRAKTPTARSRCRLRSARE